MPNIRSYKSLEVPEIEVTVGGSRIKGFRGCQEITHEGPVGPGNLRNAAIDGDTWLRQQRELRDKERFAEPLDEGLSKALREVCGADMPGAEKLQAIQALQRMTSENHCAECGGTGTVPYLNVDPTTGVPYGDTEYDDCPQCNGGR